MIIVVLSCLIVLYAEHSRKINRPLGTSTSMLRLAYKLVTDFLGLHRQCRKLTHVTCYMGRLAILVKLLVDGFG